jgi:hypothetical protein
MLPARRADRQEQDQASAPQDRFDQVAEASGRA